MPSPFPGMDPYLESSVWADFHNGFIFAIRELLVPQIRPKYVAVAAVRVYLEHQPDASPGFIRPDITIAEAGVSYTTHTAAAVADALPVTVELPVPFEEEEVYFTIRSRESRELITVIEVLSPTNKRAGSDGRREYLTKREQILRSSAALVEIDMLRGGTRLPTIAPLPSCDYCAIVSRARQRPRADAYCWGLRSPLPHILIPLAPEDAEITLDLQAAFTSNYDRAGYDYSIDYTAPLNPPLSESDREWAAGVLSQAA